MIAVMIKRTIAVIAGGDSGEYDISIKSGTMVAQMLDNTKYDVYLIHIRASEWFYKNGEEKIAIDKNDFSLLLPKGRIRFDCVFCAIHGTPGENGRLPAYFEMLGIPFTSSGSLISALTFNKNYCNRVVASYGVLTARSMHLFAAYRTNADDILQQLRLPIFVKPNAGGSSVGMSKVKHAGELRPAIDKAFAQDTEILIEEYVEGREITCGMLRHNSALVVLPLCEVISKNEFFDYEAKYNPALANELVPAPVPEALAERIADTSRLVYQKLNCKGVVRADYIYSEKTDKLYFIEINTVPGLTRESIVPKMAAAAGISLTELFTILVEETLKGEQ
jgi:D-alanine-D-alanine ligase